MSFSNRKLREDSKRRGISGLIATSGVVAALVVGLVIGYGFLAITPGPSSSLITVTTTGSGGTSTLTLTQSTNGGTQTISGVTTVTTTTTEMSTTTETVTNVTAASGPLFAIIGIYVYSGNNTVKLVLETLFAPIIVSATFSGSASNGAIPTTNLCDGNGNNQTNGGSVGQILTCTMSGFSPPILPSSGNPIYSIGINAFNPGDTELMISQSYNQSYLTVQ